MYRWGTLTKLNFYHHVIKEKREKYCIQENTRPGFGERKGVRVWILFL
jgi:hypothetical protein